MANRDMAFIDARTSARDCRPAPLCESRPVCPACGGLECLCRPRFFAGQLLTEEDLNRLDHYIVAKNRLHNRHLFGSGVVCGLEVVCDACDPGRTGGVVVRPGYALSPCGNDIVVCQPEAVDVCDLIGRCRPRAPDDCFQPTAATSPDDGADETWILTICYQEKPSRGVTALRGSSCGCGASSGCGCGSGGAKPTPPATYTSTGGCGCGGTTKTTATTRPAVKPSAVSPQCEPTLTCEGYSFAVYRLPPAKTKTADPGALIRRFLCCLQPLLENLVQLPADDATAADRRQWLASLVESVREFLIEEGLYDCELAVQLGAVALPSPQADPAAYLTNWTSSTLGVLAIVAAVFQKCLCAALLPPCPPAELDDCVPIATLTVSSRSCRVKQVCNIANRRFVPTIPALEYWLSWLPLFTSGSSNTLSQLLERLCCTPIARRFDFGDVAAVDLVPKAQSVAAAPAIAAPAASSASKAAQPFVQLLAESLLQRDSEASAATVLLAALGARKKDGSELASKTAVEHPAEAMLVSQVVAPALAPFLPLLGGLARGSSSLGETDLRSELAALKATVERQQRVIDELGRNR